MSTPKRKHAILALAATVLLAAPLVTPPTHSAAADKIKLVWWTGNNLPIYQNALKKDFVNPFNASHPGLELTLKFTDQLDRVLRTAVQAGAGPDIIETPGPAFVAEYVAAGRILSMDPYARQYGWAKSIFPWAVNAGKIGGTLYSLPLTYESMVMWYNKATFAKYGWTVPTNRAQLEKVAEAAKAKGLIAFADGNKGWKGVNEWLLTSFYNNYAGPDTVYQALTLKKRWDDPLLVGSVALLNDYMSKGYFRGRKEKYYATDFPRILSDMATGKAAMYLAGTWHFGDWPVIFKKNPKDWDWAMIPSLRTGVAASFPIGIGSTLSINAGSKNPNAAAQVLDYVYNSPKRAAQIIHDFPGEWSVPINIAKDQFPAGTDARFIRALNALATASRQGNFGYTTWTFWPAKSDQYIIDQLEGVFNGKVTPEKWSKSLQDLYASEAKANKLPPVPGR